MKYLLLAGLGVMTFAATLAFEPREANAAVCARGVHRAGCVTRGGTVVVRRPPARVCRTVWVNGIRTTRCR
jgi:hypothetical protein